MGLEQRLVKHESESKDNSQKQSSDQHQSLLDYAVHKILNPTIGRVVHNKQTEAAIEDGAKNFLKVAPLFLEGKLKAAGSVAAYVTDEIKKTDRGNAILVDAALGAAKAESLIGAQKWLGSRNTTPSLMGVEMGIVNRASETGLTRDNYYDSKGKFDFKLGLERTASAAVSSIPTDLSTFAAADALWGRLYIKSRGAVAFNPVLTSALTAGTFNVTAAAGAEVSHQIHDGKLDVGSLVAKSASAAAIGLAAGGLAGLQRRGVLNTGIIDGPDALREARSTPFQTGEKTDFAQDALKQGRFVFESQIKSPNNLTYAGKIVHENGTEIPAIFRAPNGKSDFEHRQQSEIGAYGLSTKLDLPSEKFPATVPAEAEINGVKLQGFVQEQKGADLKTHLASDLVPPGAQAKTSDILKRLDTDKDMMHQLQSAWSERLIFGEWDNHSLNQMVHQRAVPKAFNIDIGDGFRPAETSLDYVPHPGLRKSYDNLNGAIYRKLAASKFEPELTASLNKFVKEHDSPAGRKEIEQLGFTPQQVDGIIGRAKWLAENERLPRGNQTTTYQHMVKTVVRGIKFVKRHLD